ncbi:MAG: hypothetical protein LC745_06460, partial [Planctomycetia bacterium]|nr:hypothetical protein [Planctomycetia bacterium]
MHEAFLGRGTVVERVQAPQSPPPPVVERPTDDQPHPQAQWLAGYWAWDPAAANFVWVGGAWRIPPRGMLWVNGRWQRDAQGWSRVPGFWSPRQAQGRVPEGVADPATMRSERPPADAVAVDWRTTGPPADHPADDPGTAPDTEAFYVPGHYAPEGDRVVWKRGFWSRVQPGLEWVPAHWVRRADGWDYREGNWVRVPKPDSTVSYRVARPRDDRPDLPPAIVDSEPARTDPAVDPASRPRDPIAEAEGASRAGADEIVTTPAAPAVA